MTNEAHSGSRWEPEDGRDDRAELTAPAQPAPQKKRPLAALAAAGFVLVGGAGGFAIGTAAAGPQDGVPDFGGRGGMPHVDGDPA